MVRKRGRRDEEDEILVEDLPAEEGHQGSPADPVGELDLFRESGVPHLESDVQKVFDYVESKGRSVGTRVRRNRGLPPGATPENMLSVEEKAIIILGRAIGVTWPEIFDRIVALRETRGEPAPTREPWELGVRVIRAHSEIIKAIQADLVSSLEAFSPLVGGSQRLVWRARILEYYRRATLAILQDDTLSRTERMERIQALDRSMAPHMKYFDKVGKSGDLSSLFVSPGDAAREKQLNEQEEHIEEAFGKGEIDDVERFRRLRDLHHGAE